MKIIKGLYRGIFRLFKLIFKKIDKYIVVPITKFILIITERNGKGNRNFERWLTRKNTLVFISLGIYFKHKYNDVIKAIVNNVSLLLLSIFSR